MASPFENLKQQLLSDGIPTGAERELRQRLTRQRVSEFADRTSWSDVSL